MQNNVFFTKVVSMQMYTVEVVMREQYMEAADTPTTTNAYFM